jgi:hypothetical protein
MQVEMENCLARIRTAVDDQTVSGLSNSIIFRQTLRYKVKMADQRFMIGSQVID